MTNLSAHQAVPIAPFSRQKGSVLDNKETLKQFFPSVRGSHEAKQAFTTVSYRKRNLTLATWLDKAERREDSTIKTIKRLRWCSGAAMVKVSPVQSELIRTSQTCKSGHCAICNRARSAKIGARLFAALEDSKNSELFNNKYFYFLTLTLKHDDTNRKEIYLEELKKNTKQLFRSKFWLKYFPYSKSSPASGWITSYEMTLSETHEGYHIHSHILLCGERLKIKAKDFENDIRNQWIKITNDSHQVRFDLLNLKEKFSKNGKADRKEVYKASKELIKYGTKVGSFKNWNDSKANLFNDWIIKTKGRNFINCSGFFRGMQITGLKSKYDTKKEFQPLEELEDVFYYMGKTSSLKFNYGSYLEHPVWRKRAMENIQMQVGEGFEDVTDIADSMLMHLGTKGRDSKIDDLLKDWIKYWRFEANKEIDFQLSAAEKKKQIERMKFELQQQQLKLFADQKPRNQFVTKM